MQLLLTVTPGHYEAGSVHSIGEDPIILALKEVLPDWQMFRDIAVAGEDEVFLHYSGNYYICPLDVMEFHREFDNKPRDLRLELKPDPGAPTKRVYSQLFS